MTIDIGGNLKRLRKSKDITQEELAEFLGVSFQSISKWERGDCFPDITMLPSLAHFFNVTTDELLGMDRMRNETYLGDIYRRAHEHIADNKYEEAAALLRQAMKTFPNEYGLMSDLALALSFEDASTPQGKSALEEAIVLSERVLADCTNEKVRSTTRSGLCFLYERIGEHQKAISLARTLPHVWESREILLPELLRGGEYADALKKSIATVLSVFCEKIDAAAGCGTPSPENYKMIAIGPKESVATAEELSLMMGKISSFLV